MDVDTLVAVGEKILHEARQARTDGYSSDRVKGIIACTSIVVDMIMAEVDKTERGLNDHKK